MESKSRQKNSTISKPKNKTINEKQNTWSNLLNRKMPSTNMSINCNRSKNSIPEKKIETNSKSIQCDSSNNKLHHNSTSLSVFNPIRTLQFLLKEIKDLPNDQNNCIEKIVDEMNVVIERIIEEFPKHVSYSKLYMPIMNDDSMIPIKENNYNNDLKFKNSPLENKYWLMLLDKISTLENNYSQLNIKHNKSEEKCMFVTSERDKLLEKYKKSCDSLEMSNNREREYLNTITELKSKLIASEKCISKQNTIITNLNKKLDNLSYKNQVTNIMSTITSPELDSSKENINLKKNSSMESVNYYNFNNSEVSKLKSDIKQMKQIMMYGIESIDNQSPLRTLKSQDQDILIKDFSKSREDNIKDIELDIDLQYTEYNRQASAIKLVKTELQQLFDTIKNQTKVSKKLFNSTLLYEENNLSDISDEEDNHSNISNFMSIITNSSI